MKGATYNQPKSNTIVINANGNNNALDYAETGTHEGTHAGIKQGFISNRETPELNEAYARLMEGYGNKDFVFAYNNAGYGEVKTDNVNKPIAQGDSALIDKNTAWFMDKAMNESQNMDYSTDVQKLPDGRYKVVNVNLKDNDKSIYVVNDKGERTGKPIGESIFIDSFYYADEGDTSATRPRGIIDLTSKEGIDFLNNKIYSDTPSISSYMNEWKNYNFKDIGAIKYPLGQERADYTYRGSQIYPGVYASARDFGNIGAGYVAGYGLMPWSLSKFAFERFQAKQNGSSFGDGTEVGQSTSAQFLGWEKGNQAISNKLQD